MRSIKFVTAFASLIAISTASYAEHHEGEAKEQPKLVVAISVDQFSSDLFSEYRSTFTGGLKRLTEGAVFPAGYQAHAATETCPGHSTILTGAHPARSGIIANGWVGKMISRKDKGVYCAEDETVEGSSSRNYQPSAVHLLTPTLGDRLKTKNSQSRNVSVSGKDRAALMMGGQNTDQVYFFDRGAKKFSTIQGRETHASIKPLNEQVANEIETDRAANDIPAFCTAKKRPITVNSEKIVGIHDFARKAGDSYGFRASPDLDAATIKVATRLVEAMSLGQGAATDMLSIGLSATDYIGHTYGSQGMEMCVQIMALDGVLQDFFSALDARNIDYIAVLTADHGGHDLPERLREQGVPSADRIDDNLDVATLGKNVAEALGIEDGRPLFYPAPYFNSDLYIHASLDEDLKAAVKTEAIKQLSKHNQVETVFDTDDLAAIDIPNSSPENWTLAERARASYFPGRSGDILVMLKKAITPIKGSTKTYVATHGSPWDYDRRVPILFWRKGIQHFEQALPIKTVDIAPTIAATIGLDIPAEEIDGRCVDINGGAANSCD